MSKGKLGKKYTIIKSLGQGVSGDVKHAVDVDTGKEVAIKIFDDDEEAKETMKSEIEALQKTSGHCNVIELLD